MVSILFSFPATYLIYSGILRVTMNTSLNQLTIFMVLGIAADDIFVFCDAWRQTAFLPSVIANNEKRRMTLAFSRAWRAILVTSLTTAAAFAANLVSDVKPIQSFGLFASIIVTVNYVIVMMIIPSA